MQKFAIPWLIALGACTVSSSPGPSVLDVQNRSDYPIVDIRVAAVDNPSFGPNLLGGDTLNPGEEITLGVDCGVYDARVIDASGAECDLSSVDLCANNAVWVITNDTCPVFSGAARAPGSGGQKTP